MPVLTSLIGLLALQGAWKTYPLGPGFRVDMPNPPQAISNGGVKVDAGAGSWFSLHQERNSVVFGYEPLKKGETTSSDEILRNSLYGVIDSFKGRLTAQRDLVLDGWPGVEFRVSNGDGMHAIGRTYVLKEGIVFLQMASLSATALNAPSTKFFASLKLPAAAGKGPVKVAGPEFKPYPLGTTGITVDFPKVPKAEDIDLPGTPKRTMRRHSAEYMNRAFVAATMEIPQEMLETLDQEKLDQLVSAMHADLVRSLNGANAQNGPAKLGDRDTLRTTFDIGNGKGYARAETLVLGHRTVTLFVVVPAPLAKSPEIDTFFASAKFE